MLMTSLLFGRGVTSMQENSKYDLERWKKVVTENIWLHYFNNVLLEKGLITRVEWVRMSALINTRYPTSKPRVR